MPYLQLIMWFWKFPTKKMDFFKKINFSIDNDFQYFHLKTIFYIGKMISKKIGSSKKNFLSNVQPLADRPPPWCCWEMVKKCQNFTYWYFDENSKNMIIHRKTSKWKNFGKKCTYGDFDKNFQKFVGCLRVKKHAWKKYFF